MTAGCSDSTTPPEDASRTDSGPGRADAGRPDAGSDTDAGFDAGELALPYGAPPARTRLV
jgi:hypothetical protein